MEIAEVQLCINFHPNQLLNNSIALYESFSGAFFYKLGHGSIRPVRLDHYRRWKAAWCGRRSGKAALHLKVITLNMFPSLWPNA